MASKESNEMIVGLDIGTSKVVAIVGEITPDGGLHIVGLGSHQSRGLKKGVVVNIAKFTLYTQVSREVIFAV
jgi:cell division protein FtsA